MEPTLSNFFKSLRDRRPQPTEKALRQRHAAFGGPPAGKTPEQLAHHAAQVAAGHRYAKYSRIVGRIACKHCGNGNDTLLQGGKDDEGRMTYRHKDCQASKARLFFQRLQQLATK